MRGITREVVQHLGEGSRYGDVRIVTRVDFNVLPSYLAACPLGKLPEDIAGSWPGAIDIGSARCSISPVSRTGCSNVFRGCITRRGVAQATSASLESEGIGFVGTRHPLSSADGLQHADARLFRQESEQDWPSRGTKASTYPTCAIRSAVRSATAVATIPP